MAGESKAVDQMLALFGETGSLKDLKRRKSFLKFGTW